MRLKHYHGLCVQEETSSSALADENPRNSALSEAAPTNLCVVGRTCRDFLHHHQQAYRMAESIGRIIWRVGPAIKLQLGIDSFSDTSADDDVACCCRSIVSLYVWKMDNP